MTRHHRKRSCGCGCNPCECEEEKRCGCEEPCDCQEKVVMSFSCGSCKQEQCCCARGPIGPRGPRGPAGNAIDIVSITRDTTIELPVRSPPVPPFPVGARILELSLGTSLSPARRLNIFSSFSPSWQPTGSQDFPPVPLPTADFTLEVNGISQPEGSEISFFLPNQGQAGALNLSVNVGPGIALVRLIGVANVTGIKIDVPNRVYRDHATLTVITSTP